MSYDWDYLRKSAIQKTKNAAYKLIPLKQDLSTEVEFYLIDAFEIFHFQPLCDALCKKGIRAVIVAEPPWINTAEKWFDYRTAVRLLKREGIRFVTKANPGAKVAVTTQYGKNLAKYRNTKVQMYYGVSLVPSSDFMTDPAVSREFDYILVHGTYSKSIIDQNIDPEHVIIMSYPRYGKLLKNRPDKETVRRELQINAGKPVLVYCPTWDAYSSIRVFAGQINQLRKSYTVVTKPHHCTARNLWNDTDMDTLRGISDYMLDPNYSFMKTCMLGDVTITDMKSGASTEMPFVNPDMHQVICQVHIPDEEVFPQMEQYAAVVKEPEDLAETVDMVYRQDACMKSREGIIRSFYEPDINGGIKRVTALMEELCSNGG